MTGAALYESSPVSHAVMLVMLALWFILTFFFAGEMNSHLGGYGAVTARDSILVFYVPGGFAVKSVLCSTSIAQERKMPTT